MASSGKNMDAAKKFWRTPELGERLISMLDPLSTLHLIKSKMIDKDILQKIISVAVWSNFIRGTSNGEQELLEEEDVRVLVKILHCMKLEEPGPLLLPRQHCRLSICIF